MKLHVDAVVKLLLNRSLYFRYGDKIIKSYKDRGDDTYDRFVFRFGENKEHKLYIYLRKGDHITQSVYLKVYASVDDGSTLMRCQFFDINTSGDAYNLLSLLRLLERLYTYYLGISSSRASVYKALLDALNITYGNYKLAAKINGC